MSRRHTSRTAPRRDPDPDPESFMRRTEHFPEQSTEEIRRDMRRAAWSVIAALGVLLVALALYALVLNWMLGT